MMRFIISILALAMLVIAGGANARDCQKTGTVCSDSTPCKTINGISVCLAGVQAPQGGTNVTEKCWEYTDTYSCLKDNAVNFCSAISQIAGCSQTNSVCSQTAFNGTCMQYTNTYRCGSEVGNISGVIKLDGTYTITTDTINRAQCASYESNPSCKLSSHICTDPGGTRVINGLPVTKDCWGWTDTYSCITQDYQSYCIPLRQTSGCAEVSNVCKATVWDGSCGKYERTYRCDGKQGDPLPTNVTYLNTDYTIKKDQLDTAQCDPNKTNPNCTLASHVCTQPGGTRNINGLNVYKDCWQWTDHYTCASAELKSDCADLKNNPACTEQSATCLDSLPSSQCGLLEHKYRCKVKDGSTRDVTTCGNGVCVNGDCSPPSTSPDTDFGKVVAGMEAQREMGDYFDPATSQLFKGTASSCSVKLGGLGNCCKAKGGGGTQSNNYMIAGVKMFANEAVRFAGSTYVYDALFSSDLVPTAVLAALYGEGAGSSYTFGGGGNFSFYGITYTPGASPPFAFDPTSFAIAIAIQVITQYLQCDQSEQLLGLRKDQRLCTLVGSYCSSKSLGSCVTKKESYCCYNSRLSRIINEQGRVQIGKSYGDPRNPDCSGFKTADLQLLDFSKMDLSEFIQEIVPKDLNTTLLNQRAQQTIRQKSTNYFNSGQYKR